jgi:hypothetical protein
MSDENQKVQASTVAPELATTTICFCPHLGLYHYKREDGSEYFFTTTQLIQSVETYLRNGNATEADFISKMTAYGRKFPHKVFTVKADGTFTVAKLEIPQNDFLDEADASIPSE